MAHGLAVCATIVMLILVLIFEPIRWVLLITSCSLGIAALYYGVYRFLFAGDNSPLAIEKDRYGFSSIARRPFPRTSVVKPYDL